jgi:hypothetical protein
MLASILPDSLWRKREFMARLKKRAGVELYAP